ncbi:hypothetical protein LTR37_004928 [Vermiconidia calcicola]|uniref:Uncharacterized protein n=1 Tax=Vermiconidia calcicola TaxID=1690605 RepID=A0ACC3NL57_9PEZI|nr:hypothetical protein LTR37_004928 [Vermiconidia calcicola]
MPATIKMDDVQIIAAAVLDPAMTTILVGPDEAKFAVHTALLCRSTKYFRSAYRSQMKEAIDSIFRFDESIAVYSHTTPASQEHTGGDTDSDADSEYAASEDESEWRGHSEASEEDDDDDDDDSATAEHDETSHMELDLSEEQNAITNHLNVTEEAGDLNIHQLETLLRLCQNSYVSADLQQFKDKWQRILQQKIADPNHRKTTFTGLIDLFILADRFDVHALRMKTIDLLHRVRESQKIVTPWESLPSFEDVSKAFANLPATSPLRAWLVHVYANSWNPGADSEVSRAMRERLPKDFVMDVMIVNTSILNGAGGRRGLPMYERELCSYHEHGSLEDVKACRKEQGKDPLDGVIDAGYFEGVGNGE